MKIVLTFQSLKGLWEPQGFAAHFQNCWRIVQETNKKEQLKTPGRKKPKGVSYVPNMKQTKMWQDFKQLRVCLKQECQYHFSCVVQFLTLDRMKKKYNSHIFFTQK